MAPPAAADTESDEDDERDNVERLQKALRRRTVLHPDGSKKIVYYVDAQNRKHGTFVEYWPNGVMKEESTYVNGELNSKSATYHDNSQLASVRYFWKGKTNNLKLWKRWDRDGKLLPAKTQNDNTDD